MKALIFIALIIALFACNAEPELITKHREYIERMERRTVIMGADAEMIRQSYNSFIIESTELLSQKPGDFDTNKMVTDIRKRYKKLLGE